MVIMNIFPKFSNIQTPALLLVAIVMQCGITGFSHASKTSGDPAYEAFDKGHFLLAIKEAKKAAERGEPQAFTLLGRIYSDGLGVAQNYQQAASWYQKGAGKGDVDSQFALAVLLAKGRGIEQNYQLAADLFQQAAKQGHAEAQYNLALIYAEGLGRKPSIKRAIYYMQLAAKGGNVRAQYDLGTFFALGRGVQKNQKTAVEWTKKAADAGLAEAQLEYAVMLVKGLHLPEKEKMIFDIIKKPREILSDNEKALLEKSKALREEIDRVAAKYLHAAAIKGNPVAQNRLARFYLYGFGVGRNVVQASKWHLIARDNGVSDAKLDIALNRLSKDERSEVDQAVLSFQDSQLLQ
ncbi:MAG: SEL1-like repeat protein [Methyloligellaceae bacterium]